MNQRIKELAEQSVSRFDKDMDGSMEPTENGRWVYYDDLTEFAELIVRECIDKISEEHKAALDDVMEDWDRGFLGGLSCAMETVQKHFGVEL
jgi:hypothetical protein